MPNQDYSADALYKFYGYLSDKGLVKPATVRNWKNVSVQIFDILDPDELSDLRNLDIESVFQRFTNLRKDKYAPKSLVIYKSRFTSGISSFLQWVDNPSGFKPSLQTRKRMAKTMQKGNVQEPTSNIKRQAPNVQHPEPEAGLIFPVPIRDDCVVKIINVPSDLSVNEAKKIAAVITALAT